MFAQDEPTAADREFLDTALDRAVSILEEGRAVELEDLARDRPDLRPQLEEVIRTARDIAVVATPNVPTLAGYTILRELGQGGMGTVYLARQERLAGRLVAIKVLPSGSTLSPRSRERFVQEAETIAKLRHPNIVAIHDVIRANGVFAYAMEWIDGHSLADSIQVPPGSGGTPARLSAQTVSGDVSRYARDPATIVHLGIHIARALAEVHRAGLLHRDVKPSNILIRRDGTPILTDFGLAREIDSTAITQPGQFAGTAVYAAPEQLSGDSASLDTRCDIYSLGVTLYHALSGRLPFTGANSAAVLRRIETGAAEPLRKANPKLPRDLETIVAKAMEPDAARRYATADELAGDLERLLALQPIQAKPSGSITRIAKLVRRNRAGVAGVLLGAIAVAVLATAAGVYLLAFPSWAAEHRAAAQLALLDPEQDDRIFAALIYERRPERPTPNIEALAAALYHYERGLRYAPFDVAMRLERDTVQLATAVLQNDAAPTGKLAACCPRTVAYARAWRETAAPPPIDDETLGNADPSDLRCLGLLAFLCHDVIAAMNAWSRLDLAANPDPLVEASLGELYLRNEQPSRAYPRLFAACRAYRDVGFVWVNLADAAVQIGGPEYAAEARRILDQARNMPRLDQIFGLERVETDYYAELGYTAWLEADAARAINDAARADDAAERAQAYDARAIGFGPDGRALGAQVGEPKGYEYFCQYRQTPNARDHYGRFLVLRGQWRKAATVYAGLVRIRPTVSTYRQRFVDTMDGWWASLNAGQRFAAIRASLNESPSMTDSLVAMLRLYVECRELLDANSQSKSDASARESSSEPSRARQRAGSSVDDKRLNTRAKLPEPTPSRSQLGSANVFSSLRRSVRPSLISQNSTAPPPPLFASTLEQLTLLETANRMEVTAMSLWSMIPGDPAWLKRVRLLAWCSPWARATSRLLSELSRAIRHTSAAWARRVAATTCLVSAAQTGQASWVTYDGSHGTLPDAQGWVRGTYDDPLPPTVENGWLHLGPTNGEDVLAWSRTDREFDYEEGFAFDARVLVTFSDEVYPGTERRPRFGYHIAAADRLGRRIDLWLGNNNIILTNHPYVGVDNVNCRRLAFPVAGTDHVYRVAVNANGADLLIDGVLQDLHVPLHPTYRNTASNRFIFGDGTTWANSETRTRFVRYSSGCQGDVTDDDSVDLSDLALLLSAFGTCTIDTGYNPAADLDASGCIDLTDLATLLASFGSTCS